MIDTQVQDPVETGDGQRYRGVTSTTQTTADPVTGAATRRSSTRMWSGESPLVGIIGLLAAVVIVLLTLDLIFHATGAANVGSEHSSSPPARSWPPHSPGFSGPRRPPQVASSSGQTSWR
jgi:hypothetical protein